MTTFDAAWAAAVRRACDPVLAAADAGFDGQVMADDRGRVSALLWEAEPLRFAARYPDSGIVESYGDQWPAPCIDYWVHVDPQLRRAQFSTEGWRGEPDDLDLTGDGDLDGVAIGTVLAELLRVRPPSGW